MTITLLFQRPEASFALSENKESAQKLAEEFSKEAKLNHSTELMALGDQLAEQNNFEAALAAYEQVFVFDPGNTKASAKIDLLRKQMKKDQKNENGIVSAVYEQEAQDKIRNYWAKTQEYLQDRKMGQARFALEKILILDPMNEEARKLYDQIKQSSAENLDETRKAI